MLATGMYTHSDMDGMGLEPGHHHAFQYPPTSTMALLMAPRRQQMSRLVIIKRPSELSIFQCKRFFRDQDDTIDEPTTIKNRERSISAPDVSQTIITREAVLPEIYRQQNTDLRSK